MGGALASLAQARPAVAETTFNQKMLELVNQQRSSAGLAPLQWSSSLGSAAEDTPYGGCGFTVNGRAHDMGQRNYFSHTILGCAVQNVFSMLGGLGIVTSASGENIAWMNGTTDPAVAAQRLTNDLMNSPSHRANILSTTFTHVGIGSWRSSPGQTWSGAGTPLANVWVAAQVFGRMTSPPATPAVAVSPTALAFGERAVDATGPAQAVTVTNTGGASLAVSGATVTGANPGDFAVSSNTCSTVAAGGSCTVSVSFRATAAGSRTAALNISDNAAGSPHTVALSGTGTVSALPGVPRNVVATGGSGQLSVSWDAPSSGPAPDGYGVYVYDAGGYTGRYVSTCATCRTATVAELANGRTYYAAVYGRTSAVWGTPANSGWVTVAASPGPPPNFSVTQGNGQLTGSWTAPTNPGTAIDSYGMFVYDSNGYTGKYAWVCATCMTGTVTGLTNGRAYYAILYAHNALAWGSPAVSEQLIVGAPGGPGGVTATAGSGALTVSWTAPSNSGYAIDLYAVYLMDSSGAYTGTLAVVCSTCMTTTFTGLTAGRQYSAYVSAHNVNGWGDLVLSNVATPTA